MHKSVMAALAAGACIVAMATPAQAQTRNFQIPSGSLRAGLDSWARQSGRQVIYRVDEVRNARTGGVSGNLSSDQALARLLSGSGFSARTDASGAIAIVRVVASGEAPAGSAAANSESAGNDQEILVTGTNIRGARQVGAALTVLDRRAIEATGYATVEQVIQTLPQNFAGGPNESLQASAIDKFGNTISGSSVNLRGLGSDATLTLLNGRRLPGAGNTASFIDISMIPLSAVERIEVLPDGASATYGSDAIGGVVNIILRRRFDGLETNLRLGQVTDGGLTEYSFSQLAGAAWSSGSVLAVYEYYDRGNLLATERSYAANSDLSYLGGTNFSREFSNPGNITRIGTTTVSFAIPTGQDGTNLRESDLLQGRVNLQNRNEGVDLLPEQRRHSVYAAVRQDVGDLIELFADAGYSRRDAFQRARQSSSQLTVPQTNAFRLRNNLFPGRGNLTITYNLIDDLGPITTASHVEGWYANIGGSARLGEGWLARITAQYARQRDSQRVSNIANPSLLNAALASSNEATAFNPFADGSNTNAAVLDAIRGTQELANDSSVRSVTVLADGPLFRLRGESVRVAVGAEYRTETAESEIFLFGNLLLGAFPPPGRRHVGAAFAEIRLPIFTPTNAAPGFHALELSGSLRWEHYSDFGSTTNPRLGVNWAPVPFLTFRASWGRSFKAPRFDQLNSNTAVAISSTPAANDPEATGGSTITLSLGGGNPQLIPERARSWTAGFDFRPASGLQLSGTYFDIRYRGRISRPATNVFEVFRRPQLSGTYFFRNPDAATVDRYLALDSDGLITGLPPVGIEAIVDNRLTNLAVLDVRGFDIGASLSRSFSGGQLAIGLNATYLIRYRRQTSFDLPATELVGTLNYPVDFRLRGTGSYSTGPLLASLALNFTGSYTDNISVPQRSISSWTTLDVQVQLDLGALWRGLSGTSLRLSVNNLFDTDPPFANDPAALGFDTVNVNPLGRFVSVGLRRTW